MSHVRRWVDEIVFGPETARRLLFVHGALALVIGVRIVAGPYRLLGGQPAAIFEPVPVLAFLGEMPSSSVIAGVQILGGLAALLALLRRSPRTAFAVAWVCLLVLAGLRGSRGKVLHNDLLLIWASAPMLLAPVHLAMRDATATARRVFGWPIRAGVTITALAYFFAGVWKLRRSGIGWVTGDNMRWVMLWGPSTGNERWEAMSSFIAENPLAFHLTAAGIMFVELTFPVALFLRRLQPAYAVTAVSLHGMTYLVLGLDYWAWVAVVPLLYVDWTVLMARRASHSRSVGEPAI